MKTDAHECPVATLLFEREMWTQGVEQSGGDFVSYAELAGGLERGLELEFEFALGDRSKIGRGRGFSQELLPGGKLFARCSVMVFLVVLSALTDRLVERFFQPLHI